MGVDVYSVRHNIRHDLPGWYTDLSHYSLILYSYTFPRQYEKGGKSSPFLPRQEKIIFYENFPWKAH